MASWMVWLMAAGAALVLAPLLAWIGRRIGSRTKGGLMLASVLLGFGDVLDPPVKRTTEETRPTKGSPDNGEPPLED